MEIILISSSLLGGALLSLIFKPDHLLARKLAAAYIWLVLVLTVITWVFYFAGIKDQFISGLLGGIVSSGKYPARILLGYLVTSIFLSVRNGDDFEINKLILLTLTGVSLATGLSFLIATEGKAANMGEMIAFFKQSGYAIWFLYFIMTAEALGAIGVLLHFKLKTGPLATTGLMLIMIGAMYTHRHNRDPLSDSYAAISQFMTLGIMLFLFYFEREVNSMQSRQEKTSPVGAAVTS
jgi:putative oxidoreductase